MIWFSYDFVTGSGIAFTGPRAKDIVREPGDDIGRESASELKYPGEGLGRYQEFMLELEDGERLGKDDVEGPY